MSKTLEVAWVKQGSIQWEEWYTKRHGKQLKEMPGLKDHISFANYDLSHNGCPTITIGADKLQLLNVPEHKVGTATQCLEYHGFKILNIS